MAFFKKKRGRYWYFVITKNGGQEQHYIGKEEAVLSKLVPTSTLFLSKAKSPVPSNPQASPEQPLPVVVKI